MKGGGGRADVGGLRRRVDIVPHAAADRDIATSSDSFKPIVAAATEQSPALATAHLAASLAAIVAIDKSLEGLLFKMGVTFPSALCGGAVQVGTIELVSKAPIFSAGNYTTRYFQRLLSAL